MRIPFLVWEVLVNNKQDKFELVGLNLYYENSDVGITLMAKNTKEIIIDLNINRKTVENNRLIKHY